MMIDLFDEENQHTALADRWENYGTLNHIEDERIDSRADSALERDELLDQVLNMMHKTLTTQEVDMLCAHYGILRNALTVSQIAQHYALSHIKVERIINSALRKLQFSDEAITIWKYIHRG